MSKLMKTRLYTSSAVVGLAAVVAALGAPLKWGW